MVSRKGSATKAESSTAKATMKQKTLFDSFMVKNSPKTTVTPPSLQIVEVNSSPPPTPAHDVDVFSDTVNLTETHSRTSSQPVEILPSHAGILDLVADTDENTEKPPIEEARTIHNRSPSVTIVEDDQVMGGTQITSHNTDTLVPTPTENEKSQARQRRSPSIMIVEDVQVVGAYQSKRVDLTNTPKKVTRPNGRTPDQPIVIPSSPIKPVHPFFASKKLSAPSTRSSFKKSKSILAPQAPLYPTGLSQHVRGPQTVFHGTGLTFPKRASRQVEQKLEERVNYGFLKRDDTVVDDSSKPPIYPKFNMPPEHNIREEHMANHPAIARLVRDGPESLPTSRRPWSEKWRPSCAREVLGNETSAIYLRNWLRALELQLEDAAESSLPEPGYAKGKSKASNRGTKRARVVRAVEKRRKRTRLYSDEEDDNWIVYSDESEEEEVDYEGMDDLDIIIPEVPASSQCSTTGDRQYSPIVNEQDLGQLHNTILLTGPSGSGKTACVYACAEELGWDVFEVYPGIGRRNGANVENLIGEVGKNHLVLQRRQQNDILKSFLSKTKPTGARNVDDASMDSFLPSYSPRKKAQGRAVAETTKSAKAIRQSVILLEEVDILFKEDVNFWPTITRIIRECKRPVICTCNDVSLVPAAELPLQRIIEFTPCPAEVATVYLEALCSSEGYRVSRDAIYELYAHVPGDREISVERPDLRRAINGLQVKCTREEELEGRETSGEERVGRISVKKSEFLSYLDGVGQKGTGGIMDSGCVPTEDDEMGHTILYGVQGVGEDERHEEMMESAIEVAGGLYELETRGERAAEKAAMDKQEIEGERRRQVVREKCKVGDWMRGLWHEIVPYVEQIEDGEGSGRKTRNSSYVRIRERRGLEWVN